MIANFFNKTWLKIESFARASGLDIDQITLIFIYTIPIIPPLMVLIAYRRTQKKYETYHEFRERMRKSFWMRAAYFLLLPALIWGIIYFFKRKITIEHTPHQIGMAYLWPTAFCLMYALRFTFAKKLLKKDKAEKAELTALKKETMAGKDFYSS